MFPILGGRLLKARIRFGLTVAFFVSNPWREAIEDSSSSTMKTWRKVSNPWREAIEAAEFAAEVGSLSCFQSLEGGYFILPFRGVRL